MNSYKHLAKMKFVMQSPNPGGKKKKNPCKVISQTLIKTFQNHRHTTNCLRRALVLNYLICRRTVNVSKTSKLMRYSLVRRLEVQEGHTYTKQRRKHRKLGDVKCPAA